LVFIFPYLYVYLRSVEKVALIKKVGTKDLTEGDWLVEPVSVGGKVIEGNWEGLSKRDLRILKDYDKEVVVRYGIPFSPAFLFALIATWFFSYVLDGLLILREFL
jgi:hypothetical protein